MKAHKYWSIGAFITMIGTFYVLPIFRGRAILHQELLRLMVG